MRKNIFYWLVLVGAIGLGLLTFNYLSGIGDRLEAVEAKVKEIDNIVKDIDVREQNELRNQ